MEAGRTRTGWVVRSLGAFLASFITVVALSVGTDALMHKLGVFPELGERMDNSGLLGLALAYRVVYGVLGGYTIARLAPFAPIAHALASGLVGLVVSTIGAIAMWGFGPKWYPVALAVSAVPCAWIGGKLGQRRTNNR